MPSPRAATHRAARACAACAWLLASADARAADPAPAPPLRVAYDTAIGGRVNPLGLEARHLTALRARLYASDAPALRDNHVGLAAATVLSLAFYRVGAALELRPASFFTLSAGAHRIGYYGSFHNVQGYADARADFSDTAQKASPGHPAGGTEVELRAQLVGRAGPLVARSDTTVYYTDVALPAGQTVYYASRYDLLMPDGGFAITSDLDAAYLTRFGLLAGARASLGAGLLDRAQRGGDDDPSGPTVRVGPVLAYTFFDEPGARFNRPTLLAAAGWWLLHRYRTGQDVSQAVPMMTVGLRFEGELLRR